MLNELSEWKRTNNLLNDENERLKNQLIQVKEKNLSLKHESSRSLSGMSLTKPTETELTPTRNDLDWRRKLTETEIEKDTLKQEIKELKQELDFSKQEQN